VSLDIKNKILEEVIGQLAHSANAELHLLRNDKVTDKRFDVNLSRLTVGDALTKLAEISGSGSWIATMSDKLPNSTGYCVLIQIQ
jgi:hypothetical protein